MGLAGKIVGPVGSYPSALRAIDPKTAKMVWRHEFPTGGGSVGLLTTAGGLIFGADGGGNLVAFDANTGTPLWHSHIGTPSNAAETYQVDGKQYVLVAIGDTLYAFVLNQ
jgi:alcohol dehydrogenase (cytochrome c)